MYASYLNPIYLLRMTGNNSCCYRRTDINITFFCFPYSSCSAAGVNSDAGWSEKMCEPRTMWLPINHRVTSPSFTQRCKGESRVCCHWFVLLRSNFKTNLNVQSQRQPVSKIDFGLMYIYQMFKRWQTGRRLMASLRLITELHRVLTFVSQRGE